MADAKVTIAIEVDKKTGAIKVAGQEVEGLGKKAKGAGAAAATGAGGFRAMTASLGPLLAAGAVVKFFTEATSAAIKQEDAINKLNTALKINGQFSAAASKDLQAYASSLQEVTRFGDEAILEQQALLISFGLTGDALRKGTEAGLDLATALGIDLKAAMLLVGKAAAGDTSALSRYGIKIKEGIPDTEKFAAVIKVLNSRFGGAAQKDVKTFGGGIEQLKNRLGDMAEEVGFQLIPTLQKLNEQFATMLPFISKVLAAVVGLGRAFITGFSLAFEAVKTFMDSVVDITTSGIRVIFEFLRGNHAKAGILGTDLKNRLKADLLEFVESSRAANEELTAIAKDTSDRILGIKKEQVASELLTDQEKAAQDEIRRQKEKEREAQEAEDQKKKDAEKKKEDDKKAAEDKKKQEEKVKNFKLAANHITQSALFNAKQQAGISKTQAVFQATVDAQAASIAAYKSLAGIPVVGPALGAAAAAVALAAGMANVQAITSAKGFRHGGRVPGTGNEDTVPARLTPGERVLTKEQNRAFERNIAEGGGKGSGKIVNFNGPINFYGVDPRTPEGRTEIINAFAEAMEEGDPSAVRAARLSSDLNSNNSDLAA